MQWNIDIVKYVLVYMMFCLVAVGLMYFFKAHAEAIWFLRDTSDLFLEFLLMCLLNSTEKCMGKYKEWRSIESWILF